MADDRDPGQRPDVVAELKRLGRQMGETLDAAWSSAERKQMEAEIRTGARAFADEFGRALGRARGASPGDVTSKARRSAVEGLRWMSAELEALADRFTPAAEEERGRESDPGS
jgi:hypothetical protein